MTDLNTLNPAHARQGRPSVPPASAASEAAVPASSGTAERLRAVAEAASGIVGARSRESLRQVLEAACRRVLDFDAFFIQAYEPATHSFHGFGGLDAGRVSPPDVTPASGTPGETVVFERRPMLTLRADDPAGRGARLTGTGRPSESVIRCPILTSDAVLGVLSIHSYTPGLYTQADVEIVEVLAALAATALVNLQLSEERHAAESALWERERRLREAQHIARLGSWTWSLPGTRLAWSDELYRIYGHDPVSFNATFESYLACVHPDDRERVRSLIDGLRDTGRHLEFEERIVRPDETVRVLHTTVEVTRDAQGRAVRLLGASRDITEMKASEEALRASEESYRTIFDAASDAIFVHDVETGAIQDANARACDLGGCSLDELKRVGIGGISSGEPPYDAEHALAYIQRAAAGEPQRFEWLIRNAVGASVWVEVGLERVRILGTDRVLANVRNIDARKQAEAALLRAHDELEGRVRERTAELARRTAELEDAEQRFRAIVEASPTPLLLSRFEDGRVLYVNDRLEALIGAEPGSLINRSTPDFYFDPADRPRVLETVRQKRAVRDLELRIRRADGTPRWVSLSIQRLTLDDEPAIATAFLDITERKLFEEVLLQSEEHFRRLTETSYDLVQLLDDDGTIRYTGPSIRHLLGHDPDAVTGRSALEFLHTDDVPAALELIDDILRHPGRPYSREYRVRHADGGWRWFEVYARTLSPQTSEEGIVLNARDITERKLAKDLLVFQKTLLEAQGEASIDGILVVAEGGRAISFNQRFVEMWKLPTEVVETRSDESLIQAVLDQVHDPEAFVARVEELYAHPDETSRDEIVLRDGQVFDRYSAPVVSSEGEYYGRIWFFRDVTAQIRYAEDLEAARHEAESAREEANRYARGLERSLHQLRVTKDRLVQQEKLASLGQLTAGIAHEIKNPLNFVNNFASLSKELVGDLRELLPSPDDMVDGLLNDLERNAARIESHGRRADAIVQSMMLHAGGGRARRELTDLNDLIKKYVDLAVHGRTASSGSRPADVRYDFDPEIGLLDLAPEEMGRVILNLLSNAFDAVEERGATDATDYKPEVVVSTRTVGRGVEIRVIDNGTGIPETLRDRVFEPFFTTKPPGRGSGLGLSLSHDIIAQGHGGSISVEGRDGEGATFVVRLPREEA